MSLLGGKGRAGQAAGQAGQAAGGKASEQMDLASLLAKGRAGQVAGQAGQVPGARADEEMDLMSLLGGKARAGQAGQAAGQAAGAKAGEQMDLASLLAQGRAKQAAGHRRRFDRQLLHRLLGRVALVEEDLRDHERARINAHVDFAVLYMGEGAG